MDLPSLAEVLGKLSSLRKKREAARQSLRHDEGRNVAQTLVFAAPTLVSAPRVESLSKDDPEARCLPVGVPRYMFDPYPFQMVQTQAFAELDVTARSAATPRRVSDEPIAIVAMSCRTPGGGWHSRTLGV